PALQRPPDARAGIALALPPAAPPVTDASWHTGAHRATLSRPSRPPRPTENAPTHRHPPPTTTLPSFHYLPSSPTSDPPHQATCPPPTFAASPPFPHAPTRSAKTGGHHVVSYPFPPIAAASPARPNRVAPPSPPPCPSSPPPCPPSPPPRPPVQSVLPRRPRRLAPRRHRPARPSKTRFPAVAAASPPRRRRLAPPSSPPCPPSPPPRPAVANRRRWPQLSFLRSSCRHLPHTGCRCQGSKDV
ncbi:hypothetical protein BU14_0371s0027, partial [Porphyra umbilicalis]